jgi:hypothetical protein
MSIESFNDSTYYSLDEWMIPDYVKDKEYIKLLIAEVYSVLDLYKNKSPIAINDFALWLHGFSDQEVYEYLYKKNKFELPSIDLFATIEECSKECLKLIEPVLDKGRLIKIRVFNYKANNVQEMRYQSGFNGRQQLFEEAPLLVIKILDINTVPFYFLEFLSPIASADKSFIRDKLHAIPEVGSRGCTVL